jgi:hypothetical protein
MNTKNMNRKEATVDNYILRIYRGQEDICQMRRAIDPQARSLNGLVEIPSGVRYVFNSAQELWHILGTESPSGDSQPRVMR